MTSVIRPPDAAEAPVTDEDEGCCCGVGADVGGGSFSAVVEPPIVGGVGMARMETEGVQRAYMEKRGS